MSSFTLDLIKFMTKKVELCRKTDIKNRKKPPKFHLEDFGQNINLFKTIVTCEMVFPVIISYFINLNFVSTGMDK